MAEEKKKNSWISKKLIVAVSGIIVAILITAGKLAPAEAEATTQVIAGAIIMGLTVAGYMVAQGSVDKEEAKK